MNNIRNPFAGNDAGETVENVRNVLQFLAWQRQEGESTPELEDGRRLVLQACAEALQI